MTRLTHKSTGKTGRLHRLLKMAGERGEVGEGCYPGPKTGNRPVALYPSLAVHFKMEVTLS